LIIALTALLHCGCNRTGKLPPSQEENEEAAPDSGSPDNFSVNAIELARVSAGYRQNQFRVL